MRLIVQKYGGTSVGNTDRIKNVAKRVAEYTGRGDQVVVVVSAMSGVTDGLIKLAKDIAPLPSEREMDMLLATGEQQTIALTAIALHAIGVPAVSTNTVADVPDTWLPIHANDVVVPATANSAFFEMAIVPSTGEGLGWFDDVYFGPDPLTPVELQDFRTE